MADFSDKKIANRRLAGKFKYGGLGWRRPPKEVEPKALKSEDESDSEETIRQRKKKAKKKEKHDRRYQERLEAQRQERAYVEEQERLKREEEERRLAEEEAERERLRLEEEERLRLEEEERLRLEEEERLRLEEEEERLRREEERRMQEEMERQRLLEEAELDRQHLEREEEEERQRLEREAMEDLERQAQEGEKQRLEQEKLEMEKEQKRILGDEQREEEQLQMMEQEPRGVAEDTLKMVGEELQMAETEEKPELAKPEEQGDVSEVKSAPDDFTFSEDRPSDTSAMQGAPDDTAFFARVDSDLSAVDDAPYDVTFFADGTMDVSETKDEADDFSFFANVPLSEEGAFRESMRSEAVGADAALQEVLQTGLGDLVREKHLSRGGGVTAQADGKDEFIQLESSIEELPPLLERVSWLDRSKGKPSAEISNTEQKLETRLSRSALSNQVKERLSKTSKVCGRERLTDAEDSLHYVLALEEALTDAQIELEERASREHAGRLSSTQSLSCRRPSFPQTAALEGSGTRAELDIFETDELIDTVKELAEKKLVHTQIKSLEQGGTDAASGFSDDIKRSLERSREEQAIALVDGLSELEEAEDFLERVQSAKSLSQLLTDIRRSESSIPLLDELPGGDGAGEESATSSSLTISFHERHKGRTSKRKEIIKTTERLGESTWEQRSGSNDSLESVRKEQKESLEESSSEPTSGSIDSQRTQRTAREGQISFQKRFESRTGKMKEIDRKRMPVDKSTREHTAGSIGSLKRIGEQLKDRHEESTSEHTSSSIDSLERVREEQKESLEESSSEPASGSIDSQRTQRTAREGQREHEEITSEHTSSSIDSLERVREEQISFQDRLEGRAKKMRARDQKAYRWRRDFPREGSASITDGMKKPPQGAPSTIEAESKGVFVKAYYIIMSAMNYLKVSVERVSQSAVEHVVKPVRHSFVTAVAGQDPPSLSSESVTDSSFPSLGSGDQPSHDDSSGAPKTSQDRRSPSHPDVRSKRKQLTKRKSEDKFADIVGRDGLPGVWCFLPHDMDNVCGPMDKEVIPEVLVCTRTDDPCLLQQGLPDVSCCPCDRPTSRVACTIL